MGALCVGCSQTEPNWKMLEGHAKAKYHHHLQTDWLGCGDAVEGDHQVPMLEPLGEDLICLKVWSTDTDMDASALLHER